ncbi:TetR/AcrR family transcriptional regulator [Paenibacillus terrigena]|uniref:TetR/AcrR family transcriptional regulator n=1 Tax=Paenibacillus terrigena TaxID=369333 RepID=UPI0028D8D4BC|nr:TetR/AcrR family transcriptional regulator [Paenibacillus terrigena]
MARISKDPVERKNEILQAAEHFFKHKGYERTSISDIVKHIGVAQGTFYYYFKSKEEIAEALIDNILQRDLETIERIAEDPDQSGYQKMLRILIDNFAHRGEDKAVHYLHHENNAVLHQKLLVKTVKAFTPPMTSVIEQGNQEGDFHASHPRTIAEFLLVSMLFLFDPGIFSWTTQEVMDKLMGISDILENLLGTAKGAFDIKLLPELSRVIGNIANNWTE